MKSPVTLLLFSLVLFSSCEEEQIINDVRSGNLDGSYYQLSEGYSCKTMTGKTINTAFSKKLDFSSETGQVCIHRSPCDDVLECLPLSDLSSSIKFTDNIKEIEFEEEIYTYSEKPLSID